jgi:hypothetical protein
MENYQKALPRSTFFSAMGSRRLGSGESRRLRGTGEWQSKFLRDRPWNIDTGAGQTMKANEGIPTSAGLLMPNCRAVRPFHEKETISL